MQDCCVWSSSTEKCSKAVAGKCTAVFGWDGMARQDTDLTWTLHTVRLCGRRGRAGMGERKGGDVGLACFLH